MTARNLTLFAFVLLLALATGLIQFGRVGFGVICVLLSGVPIGLLIGMALTDEEEEAS